jgi:ribonucleoside-diphosphate reductase alpha chain
MTLSASGVDRALLRSDRDLEARFTENACRVLEARYLKKNEAGECIEAPAALFRRVARSIADVERRVYEASEAERQAWESSFYALMISGDFLPNSPTLMNAGREMGMLSACFVLPVRDSINDIFDAVKHTALIQKAGGGTGFAFDELRPTGDYIKSSGGTTSGPISFWRAFSEATNAIQQGAFRRGANMGMMYVHHPDILKFLHAKQDLEQFTNYNISVKITDAWMEDFVADPDGPHLVRNPRTGKAYVLPRHLDIWKDDLRALPEVTCVEPVPETENAAYFTTPRLTGALPEELRGQVYTRRDIWEMIVKNAWQTGEPGVVFIDRINEHNPTRQIGRIEATNPCGEQPLLPYEACNLGSINLGNFVRNACTPEATVDWEALKRAVHLATRFLDDVIDANNYPLPEIERVCQANRKIGLGIMGFADALYRLGVAYNSEEGVAWGERFMRFVNDEAHNYSEHLARSRGCFPNWKGSTWETEHGRPMRNAAATTVAPTGTISIIANCSGGIEPMFSLAFIRNVLRGQKQGEQPLVEVNGTFRQVAEQHGLLSDELLEQMASAGSLQHIDAVPANVKRVFVCAHDVAPEWHMRMQAAFQKHCDASISKTINFPNAATPEAVDQIYRLAFDLRCKGVTVYRDGCRSGQPMALKCSENEGVELCGDCENGEGGPAARVEPDGRADSSEAALPDRTTPVSGAVGGGGNGNAQHAPETALPGSMPPGRQMPAPPRLEPQDLPEIVSGLRIRQLTPFGNMHVKITVDPRADRELEVFAQLGKGGDVANSDLEAICRMVSLWLRSGGRLRHVIKQLEGIGSSFQIPTRGGRIMSLGDGLAVALKKYVRAKERFGLRSLLLGEIDLAELDNPHPAPHTHTRTAVDQKLPQQPVPRGTTSLKRKRRPASAQPSLPFGETPTGANERRSNGKGIRAATKASRTGALGTGTGAWAAERTTLVNVSPSGTPVTRRGNGQPVGQSAGTWKARPYFEGALQSRPECPECGGVLAIQEGCRKCHSCGWAAC